MKDISLSETTLSISQRHLNCFEIYQYLADIGIPCQVKTNWTVALDTTRENGCQLFFPITNRQQLKTEVWNPLQNKYKLGCAHIDVKGKFSGCIHDFFALKGCKGKY